MSCYSIDGAVSIGRDRAQLKLWGMGNDGWHGGIRIQVDLLVEG